LAEEYALNNHQKSSAKPSCHLW